MIWVFIATALMLGAFMAIQPAINGQLRWQLGGPAHAAMVSTAVSTISLFVFVFAIQRNPWPDAATVTSIPWWMWTGGLLGAAYVALSLVLVHRLGAAVAFSLIILGQMVFALVLDHNGWLGVAQSEITITRIGGALLVVCGAVMLRFF